MNSMRVGERTLVNCNVLLYGIGKSGEMEGLVLAMAEFRPNCIIVLCRNEEQRQRVTGFSTAASAQTVGEKAKKVVKVLGNEGGTMALPKDLVIDVDEDVSMGMGTSVTEKEETKIHVLDVCESDESMCDATFVKSIALRLRNQYGKIHHIVTMSDTHQACWREFWPLVHEEGSFLFLRMNGFDSLPTPFALLTEAMEAASGTSKSVNDLKIVFDDVDKHCKALAGTLVEMMTSQWNGMRLTLQSPDQLKLTTFNPME
eukprot:CFRG5755T1